MKTWIVRILAIVGLFCMLLVGKQFANTSHATASVATMALGFVLCCSFYAGQLFQKMGVPSITGYIAMGVLFGPDLLRYISPDLVVLSPESVKALQTLDGAALGLIALTAGGELRISIIKEKRRSILAVCIAHIVLIVGGVAALFFCFRGAFDALAALEYKVALAASLLLGVTAVANSPATTIAVLQEAGAKGPMSDIVLAVTVAKDVVVVVAFTIVVAICLSLVHTGGHGEDSHVIGHLAWEIFGSLGIGLVVGVLLTFYMRKFGAEVPLVLLGIAFLSGALAQSFDLSGLLVCIMAGFYVENFSEHGEELIHGVERHAMPLYVVFFTMTGASLELEAIRRTWLLALLLAGSRLALTFISTFVGTYLAGDPQKVQRYAWSGFLGQAGVTFGFAAIIAKQFGLAGALVKTVVIAAVAINQVVGPVLFRWCLIWAGEAYQELPDATQAELPAITDLS